MRSGTPSIADVTTDSLGFRASIVAAALQVAVAGRVDVHKGTTGSAMRNPDRQVPPPRDGGVGRGRGRVVTIGSLQLRSNGKADRRRPAEFSGRACFETLADIEPSP